MLRLPKRKCVQLAVLQQELDVDQLADKRRKVLSMPCCTATPSKVHTCNRIEVALAEAINCFSSCSILAKCPPIHRKELDKKL